MVRRCIWLALALGLAACSPPPDAQIEASAKKKIHTLTVRDLYLIPKGEVLGTTVSKMVTGQWLLRSLIVDRIDLGKQQTLRFAEATRTLREVYRVRLTGLFPIQEARPYIYIDDVPVVAHRSLYGNEMVALLAEPPQPGAKVRLSVGEGADVEFPERIPALNKAEVQP